MHVFFYIFHLILVLKISIEQESGFLIFQQWKFVRALCVSNCLPLYGLKPSSHLCSWNFPDKNTGVGCPVLLQRIFLIQGLNPGLLCLLHWQAGFLPLSNLGSPLRASGCDSEKRCVCLQSFFPKILWLLYATWRGKIGIWDRVTHLFPAP